MEGTQRVLVNGPMINERFVIVRIDSNSPKLF